MAEIFRTLAANHIIHTLVGWAKAPQFRPATKYKSFPPGIEP
jgi:hypothetical protein